MPRDRRPVAEVIAQEGVAAAIGKKHVASLLFTYRCTLACRHCLFNCSPAKPAIHTSLEDSLEFLRQLHATDRVIHVAGGEAMIFYPQLLEVCRAASCEGVAPHFVETNATFASNDRVARERLAQLRQAGVKGLLISADPYHQEKCPPGRFVRCYHAAVDIFGEANVCTPRNSLDSLQEFVTIGRDPSKLAEYARRHPPKLVGRAGDELARVFPDRPVEDLKDAIWHGYDGHTDCRQEFDPESMWEIHIDPYGNIQTCCGIVVGNARRTPLPELMRRGFLGVSPVVDAVYRGGPSALLEIAVSLGYTPRTGYPQKCGLCWEVRKFLRPHFPEALGPDEVYEPDIRGIGDPLLS